MQERRAPQSHDSVAVGKLLEAHRVRAIAPVELDDSLQSCSGLRSLKLRGAPCLSASPISRLRGLNAAGVAHAPLLRTVEASDDAARR